MAKVAAPLIDHLVGASGTAGNLVNHVCIAMSRDDVAALRKRLADNGCQRVESDDEFVRGARGGSRGVLLPRP